jgi:type VI secretion system protein ImpH
MASEAGTPAGSVNFQDELETRAQSLDFFQVLRRLECLYPDRAGFGRSARPTEDPVRLGQEPSLIFAPTMLADYTAASDKNPAKLRGYFFGLFGPNGPLPLHLTEHAQQRKLNAHDPTFADFADVFHHRMLSLFYRAWAASRPTIAFDRPATDRFRTYVGSVFGLALSSLRNFDELPDNTKLHFAGILGMQSRPAEGVRILVQSFFHLPAWVNEFQGDWMRLPVHSRLRLGERLETGVLGQSTVIGRSVWGCQQRFRIVFGPLGLADFKRMLPGRESIQRLVALVRNYLGDEKDWDVQLVLKRAEVPALQLGKQGELGWTSWLSHRQRDVDADDVVIAPAPGHG